MGRAPNRRLARLFVGGFSAGVLATAATSHASVCDRTADVRAEIVAASGAASCADVKGRLLGDITTLDLSAAGIRSLKSGDFDGLDRLDTLDLSGNELTSLPAGVFDELHLLRTLKLNDNELASLRKGVFENLFLLEELTLDGNELSSLPEGLFDEFSLFDGTAANGDPPDNSGSYPRIQRFLDRHDVTTPEGFIASLPASYKQRFAMVYESESPAKSHVSGEHPRIASWGVDAHFIFAWNTAPDAPSEFRDSVEFLRQDNTGWTAGMIDFSDTEPEIREPAACQTCHGSLNKPLWGIWAEWQGAEFGSVSHPEADAKAANMEAAMESTNERIAPLEFSEAGFRGFKGERFLVSPDGEPVVAAVEEAGGVWSWRHAEVLLRSLQASTADVRSWSERAVCEEWDIPVREFTQQEHNLFLRANREVDIEDGKITPRSGDLSQLHPGVVPLYIEGSYWYHSGGSVADAMMFLTVFGLWQEEPVVRRLYRATGNKQTVKPGPHERVKAAMLHFKEGGASAEDELIQKYRLHFGRGGKAALSLRAAQNNRFPQGGLLSASFRNGHLAVMGPKVCSALSDSVPTGLAVALEDGDAILSWQAPKYDSASVTGYRILRAKDGSDLAVHVADTGSTETSWSDEEPELGDYAYVVKTVYDSYYPSPASDEATKTVVLFPEGVSNLVAEARAGKVTLRWDAPGGETAATGYRVRRGEGADALDLLVADTGSVTTSHVDKAVTEGRTYYYRVTALNGEAAGPESDAVRADVPYVRPTAPGVALVTAARRSLAVSWSAPTESGQTAVSSYDLRYITSETVDKADLNWTVRSGVWSSGDLAYSLTGLSDDTAYDVQVRAVNEAGAGPWSATATGTTLPNRSPVQAGSLADQSLRVGDGVGVVDVSEGFEDPDGDSLTFAATSSSPSVATATVSGSRVTLSPVSVGTATLTVTATDVAGSNTPVLQRFRVTVAARRAVNVLRRALTIREGEAASYTVVLAAKPSGAVTVTPSVPADADIEVSPGALIFTTGNWNVARTVTVKALEDADAVAEAPVTVGHSVSGADYETVRARGVRVTIVETDAPTLSAEALEARESSGTFAFRVALSVASSDVVTVDYATADGSGATGATAGADYEAVSGTLTFASETTNPQQVAVNLLDDRADESEEETFHLTLWNARNASLAGGGQTLQVVGTIVDDDDPQVGATFALSSYEVAEGGAVRVIVRLDRDPEREVRVPLNRLHQGGATGSDYSGVPGEVIFGAGLTAVEFTFSATDDSQNDDGEAVVITFGQPPSGVTASGEVTVAILDDDGGSDAGDTGADDIGADDIGAGDTGGAGSAGGSLPAEGSDDAGSEGHDSDDDPTGRFGSPPSARVTHSGVCVADLCHARTGVPVMFEDTSSGEVRYRSWELGDGKTSRSRVFDHAWSAPGFYEVTLRVSDGRTESTSWVIFLVEANEPAGTCEADEYTLCLQDSRYRVKTQWRTAGGRAGSGKVVRTGTNDSGLFWFFDRDNWEILVKVLDGCDVNGNVWLFVASTTDLGYEVALTDTATGQFLRHRNAPGQPASAITNVRAFVGSCER